MNIYTVNEASEHYDGGNVMLLAFKTKLAAIEYKNYLDGIEKINSTTFKNNQYKNEYNKRLFFYQ